MCKANPGVLIVATKPQYVEQVLKENSGALQSTLVVSIAAGKTLSSLSSALGSPQARVVRVMPNTPCMVGESAAAMCRGTSTASTAHGAHVCLSNPDDRDATGSVATGGGTTEEDAAVVKALMGAVGVIEEVPENLISAVTGLSGSGPAYIYVIIEALADAGVRAGLPRATALRLAAQTGVLLKRAMVAVRRRIRAELTGWIVREAPGPPTLLARSDTHASHAVVGGGKMVLAKGHPGVLKDLVTSPGGTTIAGVHSLETSGVRGAMMNAVAAAVARADELSKL
jgi:pyrroline-5-carboxylate reductase